MSRAALEITIETGFISIIFNVSQDFAASNTGGVIN
jgi:hypothetical protein